MKRSFACAMLAGATLIAAASCRTASAPQRPLPSLTVVSPEATITALQTMLAEQGSLSSLARVSLPAGDSRRSFRARIVVDAKGALLLNALTPLGTSAFTLYADNDSAIVINPNERWYWDGKFRDLVGHLAIPFKLSPGDFGRVVFGLPPTEPVHLSGVPTPSGTIYTNSVAFVDVASAGIRSIRWSLDTHSGVAAEVALFDPPSFPPKRVSFSRVDAKGGEMPLVELEHLSVEAGGEAAKPSVPAGYRHVTDLDEIFSGLR